MEQDLHIMYIHISTHVKNKNQYMMEFILPGFRNENQGTGWSICRWYQVSKQPAKTKWLLTKLDNNVTKE